MKKIGLYTLALAAAMTVSCVKEETPEVAARSEERRVGKEC